MANGYMGNLLNVHLAEGKISDEKLSDELSNQIIQLLESRHHG